MVIVIFLLLYFCFHGDCNNICKYLCFRVIGNTFTLKTDSETEVRRNSIHRARDAGKKRTAHHDGTL